MPADRAAAETVSSKHLGAIRAGAYSLTAVFLFGTENTDRAGFIQRPSGRILFSQPITVTVD